MRWPRCVRTPEMEGMMDVINSLRHYGVQGMKWGIRKERDQSNRIRLKNGDVLLLNERPTPGFAKFLSRINPKVKETLENSRSFKIEREGKVIGELDLYKESPTSLNLVWVNVYAGNEGRGYGTAVTKAVIDYGRSTGMKQITLEVPGISKNAQHIYESQGFKLEESISSNDMWGGLTKMRLKL